MPKLLDSLAAPLTDTAIAPVPVAHREFGDSDAARKSIFDNVASAIATRYPMENARHRLELQNVKYLDTKPFGLADQKKAIMRGMSLDYRLGGDWVLTDKASGKEIDRKSSVVAHVPYMTNRGTFIYQGNEYTVANQMRLKPGVFARMKENGIVESHVNVKQGTGSSFRIYMEPDTGIFRLGVGQSTLKMYPILRAMGVPDRDIEKSWGKELLAKNIEADDPRAVARAFTKMVNTRHTLAVSEANTGEHEKEAQIGAKDSDRKWSYLWFRGKLRVSEHNGKPWVLLDTHKGLCEAAYQSLKAEGVDCESKFDSPHISVLRPEECEKLRKKHKTSWEGVAKSGKPMRFRLERLVNIVPAGWSDKYDRVWFIECVSPDLEKYRKELGFDPLPVNVENGHDMRFHLTFAVHRNQARKAAELLTEKRAAAGVGEGLLEAPTQLDTTGKGLLSTFEKMELDEDVTESTLGTRFKNAGVPMLLRSSQKLLNISRGEEDVDDRDSLAFQTVHSPEDFFAERIRKDAGQLGNKLLWKATLRGNLKHVPSGALTNQMRAVLLRSGMGQPLEEINPLDIFDQQLRVLRLGEGGIPSIDSVPSESRNVQPSHFGYLDPIRAPESEKIGVDSRVSYRAVKGNDGKIYTSLTDARTGKESLVSAEQASKSIVAFPGEMEKGNDTVRAMDKSRQVVFVDKKDVDYVMPSHNQMFSASSNLVPLISGIKGGRLLMGAKYAIQALPLQVPEAPLVQNLAEGGKSFDDMYGERVGAIRAKDSGIVTKMDRAGITVRYADGKDSTHELYENFPFNRKTFVHNTPAVKIGDKVAPGQLLAKSNYTDDSGTLAIGTNLRTAYMPYRGLNYEDAIVVSESAAKKLSSEHMYQNIVEADDDLDIGRRGFVSIYPGTYAKEQLGNINEAGVVKVGSKVKHGDPLVLALKKAPQTAVHRGHKAMFSDGSLTWDHESDGVVTDVDQTKDGGWNVTVKAYSPSQEGDKLAGRYGDKGVIARVIPDDQMPHGQDGAPYEILLNPLGINSRGNPSQLFETLLGKVARQRGSAVKVPSFMTEHLTDFTQAELTKAGLKDVEDLTDPRTGKKIPEVLTGERFIMKLHHTAESKGRGRDVGAYTSEGLPAKGGEFGAKRISSMEQNSLLSHGATSVIRDAQAVRGQRNDDYWRAFRLGLTPPSPKVPLVYQKFMAFLPGAGINVKKDGNKLQLFALTDKDIDKLSAGAVRSPQTVSGDKLTPIAGGLFDEGLTGGHGGNRWSHIDLAEPLPNPVMEEPIRRLLGLTGKQYTEVLQGQRKIGDDTGGLAIKKALGRINIDSMLEYHRGVIKDGPRSKRDNSVKSLGYLKTMKEHDLRPEDWVLSKAPVLPPNLRPITMFKSRQLVADPNFLYKDLLQANEDLREMNGVVDPGQLGEERLRLYQSFKAVTGLGDPVQAKTQEKGVRGLLAHVFGASPKLGMFQRRVLGSAVDVVGRATITPNPDLSMDQVGLPETKAWIIYRPFIVRRLIRSGMPATDAARAVATQADVAKRAMLEEMGKRPVIINRAPTLHRYGFMAAWPVLTKSNTLQISPVLTPGFGADFDGDAMNYHVPADDEAVKDATDKMMPSKNLRSVRDFQVHYLPKNEFLYGLYLATSTKNKKEPRVFKDKAAVLAAYQRGEIGVGDPVVVK